MIGVGLALRVGWWWIAHPEPVSDFLGYRSIAIRWVTDGVYTRGGVTTAFRTPGYPAFLGLGLWIWESDRWLSMLNVFVSTAAIPLSAWFAITLGLGRRIALVTAALVAVVPTFVFWAPVLASEHVQIAVLLVAWSLTVRASTPRQAIGVGVLYGVAILVRPESIFFVLAVPILIRFGIAPWRRIVPLTLVVAVTAGLIVAPWYVRNEVVVGRGAGLSTSGGLNFYLAHREHGYRYVEPDVTPLRGLDELAMNRRGYELGLDLVRHRPADVIRTTLRYSYELYRAPTYTAHYSTRKNVGPPYHAGVSRSTVQAAKTASSIAWVVTAGLLIVGFGALAFGRGRDRRALAALLALVTANWLCFAVVFWGMPRYRYAIEPVLAIMAAVGVVAIMNQCTRSQSREVRGVVEADQTPLGTGPAPFGQ